MKKLLTILIVFSLFFGFAKADSTTTNSTDDGGIRSLSATTPRYAFPAMTILNNTPDLFQGFAKFVMPADPNGSGSTITKITLSIYIKTDNGGKFDIHRMTRNGWTGSLATWLTYDGSNNWTTAGGDYSATIVNTLTPGGTGYKTSDILGGSATNSITATWGDTISLEYLDPDVYPIGGETDVYANSTHQEFLTITFTSPPTNAMGLAGD